MKYIPDETGYKSTNYSSDICKYWCMFNYVASKDRYLKHYDSWAVYHPAQAGPVFNWCEDNVQHEWAYWGGKFYFKVESDAVLFTLRWS